MKIQTDFKRMNITNFFKKIHNAFDTICFVYNKILAIFLIDRACIIQVCTMSFASALNIPLRQNISSLKLWTHSKIERNEQTSRHLPEQT